jgi:hypothetical protein
MADGISSERIREISSMLLKTQSVLDRFRFLNDGDGTDIVKRGENWFRLAETRAAAVGRFDALFSGVHTIETLLLMEQARDAYILGLLDTVPVICRTALEDELTIRYLLANNLVQQVLGGTQFRTFVDGTTRASLETLIQWATTTNPKILTGTRDPPTGTLSLALDLQEVGNDYAHAYAMRRAVKPMTGTGNLFTNARALEVYEKSLNLFNQMP